jgi:predicted RND superfamily exporter protein
MGAPREGLPERLARSQFQRPWPAILISTILAALSVPIITGIPGFVDGLTLKTEFTAMLPESSPSVRDLDEIQRRFGGQQAMNIVIEARDIDAVHRFTRALAPRIEALDEKNVVAVDWNVGDFATFLQDNRHLYAELSDLTAIRDAIRDRLDYERGRGFDLGLDDEEEEPADPGPLVRQLETKARTARRQFERRFPDGFIQNPRRPLVIMVVHTGIPGGDTAQVDELIAAIEREIERLDPDSYAPDLEVHYGGTLIEVREETVSLIEAVETSTILTVVLVLIAIFVFFLRLRPGPLLLLGLIPPVLVTFAVAELTVDYLNASSAFLSAIVVGNGINPSILWLARYFEERRAGNDVHTSLINSHRGTWKGTLTASLAASLAYVSLMSTDYRGFRDFGIVGGSGMVFCWLSTYVLVPSLTVASERIRPLSFKERAWTKNVYGIVFARLALGSPWAVVIVSTLITIGTGVLVGLALASDPMEYDFRNLRSERAPDSEIEYVLEATRPMLDDTTSGSALAVLAASREDAQLFVRRLEEQRDRFPRAYGEVESIDNLLPRDQEEKIGLLAELRELMLEIRPHVEPRMQRIIDEQLPAETIRPLGPDDLPRSVARPFTERDGTRGRLVFLEHHPEESSFDGVYMARWSAAARTLQRESEHPPPVAGIAVVFSDLTETIWRDGPRAVGIAFLAVVLLLIVTFREQKERWLTLAALLVGILWMGGTMALMGMKLNFLNFVAFPIALGNGVDYSVNIVRRYADEVERGTDRLKAVRQSVEATGGAVILCSLTTTIGYISIHASSVRALQSFGAATAIAEVTTLAAAVIFLPAVLYLLGRRRQRTRAPSRQSAAPGVG